MAHNRPYGRSCRIVATGGQTLGDKLKEARKAIVAVETDDASISLGLLISETKGAIKVAYVTKTRPMTWEVALINRDRIRSLKVRG